MLTKILFTVIVIVGVAIFYRQKAEKQNLDRAKQAESTVAEASISPRTLAYILIAARQSSDQYSRYRRIWRRNYLSSLSKGY